MTARSNILMRRHKQAFTLIELLVVVTIIVMMIALLLPALHRAREAARAAVCLGQQRQVGVAYLSYGADHRGIMPGAESYSYPNTWRRWPHFFDGTLGATYINAKKIPTLWRCTKNTSGNYGVYFRFNIWWNGSPHLDNVFMGSVQWGATSAQPFLFFKSSRIPRPAETALLADTSADIGSPDKVAQGAFKFSRAVLTSPTAYQGVWLTHQGNSNITFADGHSTPCNGKRLLSLDNGKLRTTPSLGGIRFWKEEDGTLVTN